jgi:hypothetical protein
MSEAEIPVVDIQPNLENKDNTIRVISDQASLSEHILFLYEVGIKKANEIWHKDCFLK